MSGGNRSRDTDTHQKLKEARNGVSPGAPETQLCQHLDFSPGTQVPNFPLQNRERKKMSVVFGTKMVVVTAATGDKHKVLEKSC